ncbi:MAG: hypothetical protein AAF846_24935 [Chloroflexota bacterium]
MSANKRRAQFDNDFFDTDNSLPELNIQSVDEMGFGGLPLAKVTRHGDVIKVGAFHISMKGLQIQGDITQEEWWAFFEGVQKIESAIQFIIGDLAAYGAGEFEISYQEIAEKTGYKVETVENYASIARNVPQEVRNAKLSFNHHQNVAKLESNEQKEYWLRMAEDHELSVRNLRDAITIWEEGGDPQKYLMSPHEVGKDNSPVQDARLKMAKERTKVMKKAQSKNARKLWLMYAREQASEWQELVAKIAEMEAEE